MMSAVLGVMFRAHPIPRRGLRGLLSPPMKYELWTEGGPHLVPCRVLVDRCGGGRNTEFQEAISIAKRLAQKRDKRWVSYPYLTVVEDPSTAISFGGDSG